MTKLITMAKRKRADSVRIKNLGNYIIKKSKSRGDYNKENEGNVSANYTKHYYQIHQYLPSPRGLGHPSLAQVMTS
jgi:hypothetical protein